MLRKLLFVILIMTGLSVKAQNQNWVATAVDGNRYDIDSIVNTGKTVLVDVSAYWCLTCWDIHLSGILDKLYNEFGPNGTDDLFIIFVDGDPASSIANLTGAGVASQGNWLLNCPYPVIGPYGEGNAIQNQYQMNGYPSLFLHCPGSTNGVPITMDLTKTWEDFLEKWKAVCPAPFDNGAIDATLIKTEDKQFCDGEHPVVDLYNQGSDPLTAATVDVKLNNVVLQSKNWTGNLAQTESQAVEFENVNLIDGAVYEFGVTVNQETYTTGNTQTASLSLAPESPTYNLTLDLQCNSSAAQTTWRLLDENDNIVASSPSQHYTYNQFYTYDWNLTPNSCYTFIMRNEYGEGICCNLGSGYYNIRSTVDSSLSFIFGGAFIGYEESHTFHTPLNIGITDVDVNSEIEFFPNPTSDKITLDLNGIEIESYSIYDVLGAEINSKIVNNELDLSSQPAGIYFLKLNTGKKTIEKKIILSK